MEKYILKITNKILLALALFSIWGAVVYRLYALNRLGVILAIVLAVISYFIIIFIELKINKKPTQLIIKNRVLDLKNNRNNFWLLDVIHIVIYVLLVFLCFFYLFKNQTIDSIISPWQVIPTSFFISYFLATVVLIAGIYNNRKHSLLLIIAHLFLSFTVAIIVFKLGYGFDNFIHEATLNLIDKNGAVYPKPLYYLGQYSLIIIFHKLFFIPISVLNKFLVPALAAIFLPLTAFYSLKQTLLNNKQVLLAITMLLILPFSIFIISTPQNLAYLFLAIIILLSLSCKDLNCLIVIYSLAAASLLIQPIAGIPTFIFALILTIYHSDLQKFKKGILSFCYIIAAVALPLAFTLIEKISSTSTTTGGINNPELNLFSWPKFLVPGKENFLLNFVYLYGFNFKIIITAIIAVGVYIAWRRRQEEKTTFLFLGMSLSLLVSYFICALLPLNFLISYERTDFLNRILIAATLFALPFILISFRAFISRVLEQEIFIKFTLLIFISSLITASLYISYPRYDRYFNSRGYSVGEYDLAATKWIEENTKGDFIVLANQQVSAAALSQFGFKKYYKDNIFYYPIPTSSPLYRYYLDMVYKTPTKKTMIEAMDSVGTNEAYFILNKYWWQFPKVLAEAKFSADSWQELGNGNVFVFKYSKD